MFRSMIMTAVVAVCSIVWGEDQQSERKQQETPSVLSQVYSNCIQVREHLARIDDPALYQTWRSDDVSFNELTDLEKDVFYILQTGRLHVELAEMKGFLNFLCSHMAVPYEERVNAASEIDYLGVLINARRLSLIETALKKHANEPIAEELKFHLKNQSEVTQ